LEEIDCGNNLITNIILPNELTNLKKLNLQNNNFASQNLAFLVETINLEELVNNNIDSLGYLSDDMKQLKELSIYEIEVDEFNFDKLPNSLERIYYSTKKSSTSKFVLQLKAYE